MEKLESEMRKQVVKCLRDDSKYSILFKKEMITDELINFTESEEEKILIGNFNAFTTYFQGFFENRKNMFSDEEKSTAISYRIVNQNLPKYMDNCRVFRIICETELSEKLEKIQSDFATILGSRKLEEYFEGLLYDRIVTNKDISIYNAIIGGITLENGTKIQGINEYVNLYNQDKSKDKTINKLPMMKFLYKQILADRETLTFVDEQFVGDQQVIDTVQEVIQEIYNRTFVDSGAGSLESLLQNIAKYDLGKIYVTNGTALSDISNVLYGDWSIINNALEREYDSLNVKKLKNERYYEKRAKDIKNVKCFSLEKLNYLICEFTDYKGEIELYYSKFCGNKGVNLLENFKSAYDKAQALLVTNYSGKKGLNSDKQNIAILKQLLDSVKNIESFIKTLLGAGTESEKEDAFYGELDGIYKTISLITPLYNKVRNYVTRKPYSDEKIKLTFQNPTLLKGWDKNKERDNLSVLFRKDGAYYLGIMDKRFNKSFLDESIEYGDDNYEKIEYKLLPGPNKMLPKVFFADSNVEIFKPTPEILKIYNSDSYKQGPDFDLKACHKLIDFYKTSIGLHEDWSKFGMCFKDTKEYTDISQFYHDVERQGYLIRFRKISKVYIEELVEQGKLYLFQIYNKDYSPYAKGTPNLHTLYWEMLFDERNLKNIVYKLNGEAEMFFRKASIAKEDRVIHKRNVPILKKNSLAKENNETSIFEYDLIKDRRYTVDKYQLHVPITMNFCVNGRSFFNGEVLNTIRRTPEINVIGIDRGERNLLYITVTNQKGEILEQRSLNVVKNDKGFSQNYHTLLSTKEQEMDSARKNWMEIESIKELKEGYLSQAIHQIAGLMVKYQAIVVMEDLNFGFKNERKKVGKQVYQKFEKMLIDKLNYLVDKKRGVEEIGGALHAYQLTNNFESFKKLGKQSGFLFYVPAWNTSKLDPMTGFVDLLHPKYTNEVAAKEFIRKFKSIHYNEKEEYFEFSFAYSSFTEKANGTKDNWTICSFGNRIVTYRNPDKNNCWDVKEVNLTNLIKMHLEEKGIDIRIPDLKEAICNVNDAMFFRTLMGDIRLVLQIRNSIPNSEVDYMLSPIKNARGEFYDSRKYDAKNPKYNQIPENADANGAYNIARKGLLLIEQIKNSEDGTVKLAITNKDWLNYAQEHILR